MDKFSIKNTNMTKGIAVCFLIMHHLFWDKPNVGMEFDGIAISQRIGIIGKVCVAIFFILSGYGLTISANKSFKLKEFYKKRLSKLYLNYWIVLILSIIIGLCFFRKNFLIMISAKNSFKAIAKLILNITGLQFITGYMGYSAAWWFVTCIIILYLLFPIFRMAIKKYDYKFLIVSIVFLFCAWFPINIFNIRAIANWFFPFILGIYIAEKNIFEKIYNYMYKGNITLKAIIFFILLIISLIIREGLWQTIYGYNFDSFLGVLIILMSYIYLQKINILNKSLVFLGENSMNIFLVHMFITHVYTRRFVYSLRNPFLMFIFVLIISLIFSVMIEKFKRVTKLNTLILRV